MILLQTTRTISDKWNICMEQLIGWNQILLSVLNAWRLSHLNSIEQCFALVSCGVNILIQVCSILKELTMILTVHYLAYLPLLVLESFKFRMIVSFEALLCKSMFRFIDRCRKSDNLLIWYTVTRNSNYFLTSEYFRHCNQLLTMSGSSDWIFKGYYEEMH